jgi:uncharacterized membrane protein
VGPALEIGALWLAFAGSHLALSSRGWRAALHARLGENGFRSLYSLLALACFVPLVWIFAHAKHAGPLLWSTLGPAPLARALNGVLMALAGVLLVAALLPASAAPSSMAASGAPRTPRGLLRVTRHPMLAAFGLFGVAHLLVNGALADVLFFGGWPLFAWIGARHQDARLRRDRPGYAAFADATSTVPFAAIAAGRQRLVVGELPWGAIAGGLALVVALQWWHAALFGGVG